jgi:hypothetical protein
LSGNACAGGRGKAAIARENERETRSATHHPLLGFALFSLAAGRSAAGRRAHILFPMRELGVSVPDLCASVEILRGLDVRRYLLLKTARN